MRLLSLVFAALLLVGFSAHAQFPPDQIKQASGRFYCNGASDFNMRMDVDFFGNQADIQVYNSLQGQYGRHWANWDQFRSTPMNTEYELENLGSISFPADYEEQHWFQLVYQDAYGLIFFDCNHF